MESSFRTLGVGLKSIGLRNLKLRDLRSLRLRGYSRVSEHRGAVAGHPKLSFVDCCATAVTRQPVSSMPPLN